MDTTQAKLAIDSYFASEAAEMYCILGGGLALALCSALLWSRFNDQFSAALSVTLAVVALLLFATGGSLLIRDSQNHARLLDTLQGADTPAIGQAIAKERGRMQKVAGNYQNLRYAFAALAIAGALLVALTHHYLSHAIAVGLMLFAVAGTVIDRYSETRALVYLDQLDAQA